MHAVTHAIVAYNDHGKPMFNYSEWLGEVSGYRSAISIIPERGAALRPRPKILLSTWPWTLDMTSSGNFGRRLRGNSGYPSGIRTSRRRMRFLRGDNVCGETRVIQCDFQRSGQGFVAPAIFLIITQRKNAGERRRHRFKLACRRELRAGSRRALLSFLSNGRNRMPAGAGTRKCPPR